MITPAEHSSVGAAPRSPELITVAFATGDGEHIDQHFGLAERFLVYGISDTVAAPISSKSFAEELQDGNEDKLKIKLAWLEGCDVLVCAQIGQSAAQQIIRLGTQPIAVKGDPSIDQVLEQLQGDIRSSASWTRRLKRVRPDTAAKQPPSSLGDTWQED